MKTKIILVVIIALFILGSAESVQAEEVDTLQQELDYSELDSFMEETAYRDKVTFSDVVDSFLGQGGTVIVLLYSCRAIAAIACHYEWCRDRYAWKKH